MAKKRHSLQLNLPSMTGWAMISSLKSKTEKMERCLTFKAKLL